MTTAATAGSKFFIGTSALATNETQFAADTYVEVKHVEDLGEFGDEDQVISVEYVGSARARKYKGTADAGTLVLVVSRDALDEGQVALKAAQKTDDEYNFKIVADDAPGAGGTASIYYFRGLVTLARDSYGGPNNVVKTTFNIPINSEIIEVLAEEAEA